MIVKCIHNTGAALTGYERKPLGTSEHTQYGELDIGKEYLVMGMIMKRGYLTYLLDDSGIISACPSQLFDISNSTIPVDWHFKAFTKEHSDYLNKEAVWGYHELVFDDTHYEKLVEGEEEAERIYFKRKIELEKELAEQQ
ncbi:hypothetical protein NBRC110019_30480 [Neptunitalea chrysea]|uniref:Uncharacterized protein n=1 Tax=Neptunitalea chrysea TaxID=1647581 RepID=A0A9W6EWK0_9FLAO|nr:hypothetical protein [Neptunitalea chrysea]GLB54007.1 hypothetical protein NBRC110019_30480 [Neptunitalea chrysea]